MSLQCNMEVSEKCDFEVQCNLFLDHDNDDKDDRDSSITGSDSCITESDCSSESIESENDVSDMDVSYERESTPSSCSDNDIRSVL